MQGPGALTDKIIPPQFQYPTLKKNLYFWKRSWYLLLLMVSNQSLIVLHKLTSLCIVTPWSCKMVWRKSIIKILDIMTSWYQKCSASEVNVNCWYSGPLNAGPSFKIGSKVIPATQRKTSCQEEDNNNSHSGLLASLFWTRTDFFFILL